MNINTFYSQIRTEEKRNEEFLHLTANEPLMSQTAREFMGSQIADYLDRSLKGEKIQEEVKSFIAKFQKAQYSFD